MAEVNAQAGGTAVGAPARERLLSLDVLRGITMAFMILVNTAGDGSVSYHQLRHSVWNGCTLTDLVFPMFLFIVGASVWLALQGRLRRGASRAAILAQAARRSLLILLIGLAINAMPWFQLGELRYYGVLQRIAVCFAAASVIYLFGGLRGAAVGVVVAVGGYWLLMTHVAVPGFGMPGVNMPIADPHGNLAAWLDRVLVPAAHRYHHTFYDPEGLLSTLPAIGSTLLGVLASAWLQSDRPLARRAWLLACAGVVSGLLGLWWGMEFPINKRLWTSSYVLWTAGISMLALALLFWLIDGPLKLRRGLLPWRVFGTNALTAYILSEVLATIVAAIRLPAGGNLQEWLYHLLPQWLGPPPFVSLVYSVLYVGVCFLPVYVLYRRGIFLKV